MREKKTFDAVAFMRGRREDFSLAYASLRAKEIEGRVQQSLKDNPLWRRHSQAQAAAASKKK